MVPSKHALLVGVSDYFDRSSFAPLVCCKRDVQQLFRRVVNPKCMGFQKADVVVMHDDLDPKEHYFLPLEAQVLRVLRILTTRARPEDTFLFYFSGHGCVKNGEVFLVAKDTHWDELDVPDKGLRLDAVKSALDACKASRKLVIIDSCHSGEGVSKSNGPLDDDAFHDALGVLARGSVVLASCEKHQRSWITGPQSVFTKYLLAGLDGAAADTTGEVNVLALSAYVGKEVAKWAAAQVPPLEQTPTFCGSMHAQGLVLVPRRRAAPSPLRMPRAWRPDIFVRSLLPPSLGGYYTFEMSGLLMGSAHKSRPMIRVRLQGPNDGEHVDVNAILDSGADISVIPTYLLAGLGYEEKDGGNHTTIRLVDGSTSQWVQYPVRLAFANRLITESMVAVDTVQDPILGLSWLRRFEVVMDFRKNRVLLRPYAE